MAFSYATGGHSVRLSEGFSISDVTGDGAHFTPMPSNMSEAELESAHNAFDGDALVAHYRADILDVDTEKYNTAFERLRSVMENVTEDGSVKKKVRRTGADVVVPKDAFVVFHYTAYLEAADEPFDSSVLQGKPCRVKLGSGGLVEGLELALMSMRKSEKADFLVKPHMAYGPRGCPPRIPANAEILYDVELLDWTVTPTSEVIEAIDEAFLSDTAWEKAKAQASKLHLEGNHFFQTKKYPRAIKSYQAAEKIVSTSRLQNDKEEEEHNHFLVKLHSNMAMCHKELKNYNKVCIHCREAIQIEPKHAKAHYLWGVALTAMNEFSSAKDHLLKAKNIAKNDKAINDALNMLEDRVRSTSKQEKVFWKKAMNPSGETNVKNQNQNVTTPSSMWKEELKAFKNNSDKNMLLPGGMDDDELDAICADVKALNLKINITSENVCVYKE